MKWIETFAKAGASSLSMHIECFQNINNAKNAINQVKSQGMKCGIALKPETPIEIIFEIVPLLDFVLVMTVSPGFGGQQMRHECLEKVKTLRKMNSTLDIEVDGGILGENVHFATDAGANWIVPGTGICAIKEQKKTIEFMRAQING